MSHFPRKVLDPELNAEATIDECVEKCCLRGD
jgi:hypothetical protein